MKPTSVGAGMLNNTFAREYTGYKPTITNCYFVATENLPTDQGKQPRKVTAGENVTISDISRIGSFTTTYDVSGITAYAEGISYGGTFYYGKSDRVELTLSMSNEPALSEDQSYIYSPSAGELTVTENPYTLTMPDADVTINRVVSNRDWAYESNGTQEDPYRIYTKEHLDLLATRVNDDTSDYNGKYFKLMNDIEYSHEKAWDDATSTENNFTVIGGYHNYIHYFKGDFDGNGHTISGIRIYKSGAKNADNYQGLFGQTGSGANIHDLTLADIRITGYDYTGGLVGLNEGTVSNCHVANDVAIHALLGYADYHGGIVGKNNNGTVSNCTSSATLSTAPDLHISYYGAICGYKNNGTLRDNLAIGATVPTISSYWGAICGQDENGTLQRNYYIGCTVAGTANATGVGCQAADITTNSGAVPAYNIIAGEYVTVENAGGFISAKNGLTFYDTGFMLDDVLYAGSGETVSLTLTSSRILFDATYQASAGTLTASETGNPYTFTMPAANVTISVTGWTPNALSTDGSGNYLISSADDWDNFAYYVESGLMSGFKDKTVKLNNDITVTEMVGTDGNHTFRGTFDGDGHTLTVNYDTDEQYAAPFRYTYGTTIKNLKTAGTITTSSTHAGGVVGRNGTENTTLSNVSSDMVINSSFNGKAYHGGLMGYAINATFAGCAFTGKLLGAGSHHCGGLLGQKSATQSSSATFTDCLFAPAEVTVSPSNSYSYAAAYVSNVNVANSYYTETLGGAQEGTKAYAYDTDPGYLGDAVRTYDALTAYANGILFGGKYYGAFATITLDDNSDNTATITGADGNMANVTLTGRTLYKDGKWNTICLPFNVVLEGSPFKNATARTLTAASITGTTLNLTFGDAVDELTAGTPYIIKWDSGSNLTENDLVFSGVTIDATERSYDNKAEGDARVRFLGTYNAKTFDAEDKSILFLGGTNTLYYPLSGASIGAQRAYFKIGSGEALARQLTSFNIDFGEGDVTGIISVNGSGFRVNGSDGWYSLDGRRLDGKPSRAGVYINKGIKVVVK